MEMKIPEFEKYLLTLKGELKLNYEIREKINNEIYLNLYDKFNELLVKGYGIPSSVILTLENFEEPKQLAKMFNRIYTEQDIAERISKISFRKVIAVAAAITILMLSNILW